MTTPQTLGGIFSVDAETDGLYGDVWAIGVAVLDKNGDKVDKFEGMVDPQKLTLKDEWVKENILPNVNLEKYQNKITLRDAFWAFWMKHRENNICLADVGSPVESGLFRTCVEDNPEERSWNGPYPLHEVSTALLCAGVDPDIDRIEFSGVNPEDVVKHNPVDDAIVSAKCWQKAMDTMAENKKTFFLEVIEDAIKNGKMKVEESNRVTYGYSQKWIHTGKEHSVSLWQTVLFSSHGDASSSSSQTEEVEINGKKLSAADSRLFWKMKPFYQPQSGWR